MALAWSAVVQALAAVVVAAFTVVIAWATSRYVGEMATANRLQAEANAISSALVAQAAMSDVPFLVATASGGSGEEGGPGTRMLKVENRGGGLAHRIGIQTTWGDASVDSLGAAEGREVPLSVETGYDSGQGPQALRFRFTDAHGVEWTQQPNHIPTRPVQDSVQDSGADGGG